MPDCTIRAIAPAEWHSYRDLRLRALKDAPDAFGTRHADAINHADDYWQGRLSNLSTDRDLPLFADYCGKLTGLAWGKIEKPESLGHLFQMWVAPDCRGHGIGRMLVNSVVEWARSKGARTLLWSVACGNTPARRLYESAGFGPIGRPQPMRTDSERLEQPMIRDLSQDAAEQVATNHDV